MIQSRERILLLISPKRVPIHARGRERELVEGVCFNYANWAKAFITAPPSLGTGRNLSPLAPPFSNRRDFLNYRYQLVLKWDSLSPPLSFSNPRFRFWLFTFPRRQVQLTEANLIMKAAEEEKKLGERNGPSSVRPRVGETKKKEKKRKKFLWNDYLRTNDARRRRFLLARNSFFHPLGLDQG